MSAKRTDVQTHSHSTLSAYAQVTVQALFMAVFFTADSLKQRRLKRMMRASYTQFGLQELRIVKL